MKDAFDLQDKLYEWFTADSELINLLGNPSGEEELNNKFRREDCLPELVTMDKLDFIAFFFINSLKTRNCLVNEGILQIEIYAAFRYNAKRITQRIKTILAEKYPELRSFAEGQIPSGITGIYKYRLRFDPLIAG